MIKNCPMRHENGNCIPAGGFCTANKNICEALLNAYRMGKEQLSKESTTSDLIDRQAAIDALEKVAELFPWRVPGNRDTYDRYNEAWNDAIERAEIEIEELPSAQPEIIRCKDCKYAEYIDDVQALWCTECGQGRTVAPNDFCSYAERRTE